MPSDHLTYATLSEAARTLSEAPVNTEGGYLHTSNLPPTTTSSWETMTTAANSFELDNHVAYSNSIPVMATPRRFSMFSVFDSLSHGSDYPRLMSSITKCVDKDGYEATIKSKTVVFWTKLFRLKSEATAAIHEEMDKIQRASQ